MQKIPVGVLGATGMVGKKCVELLASHPWFEITALIASERSSGKRYGSLVAMPLPSYLSDLPVLDSTSSPPCQILFSGLESRIASSLEERYAQQGYHVISNASSHRMHPKVPLLIPEVNSEHLQLIKNQGFKGSIVTNPNCSATGITLVLKPLIDHFGIESVHVVTLQALSGAGYPGIPSLDIFDNVIPFIEGEEGKVETEPLKILGTYSASHIVPYPLKISAHCTRVAVSDGHLACVTVKLGKKTTKEEILSAWKTFTAEPQHLQLPSAPIHPLIYLEEENSPQPKHHRSLGFGMSVSIGQLRACSLWDWKFTLLSHNTIRGAAGSAILNAELMLKKGYL